MTHELDVRPDLEQFLRETLQAVAATTPEPLRRLPTRHESSRGRPVALVAAVIVALVGAGAVVVVARHGDDHGAAPSSASSTTVTPVPSGPSLLGPPAVEEISVIGAAHFPVAVGAYTGAVQFPNGEVAGFVVGPYAASSDPALGQSDGDERSIGEHSVDRDPPSEGGLEWYATHDSCAVIAVTTSEGMGPWAPEVAELFEWLTITDGAIEVEMSEGWRSLGVAEASDLYTVTFSVEINGGRHDFMLDQRPGASVAAFLGYVGNGTPRQVTLAGRPAWLMRRRDNTGADQDQATVVFDHAGTAVALSGTGVTDGQLFAVASRLVEQPWPETVAMAADAAPAPATTVEVRSDASSATDSAAGAPVPHPEAPVEPTDASGCSVSLTITPTS